MKRQEVLDFILSEIKRLNEEEHIHDLNKAGRYEELSKVECKSTRAILDFLLTEGLQICEDEIPEGGYLALAIWVNAMAMEDAILDEAKFAGKLSEEAGKLGKSIAYKIVAGTEYLHSIISKEFFSDDDASKYEEEFE